jgi:small redox-active disulfide protein 2
VAEEKAFLITKTQRHEDPFLGAFVVKGGYQMKIQILGTGCPKCKTLTANAEKAVTELGIQADIQKVTDLKEIMAFGVMMTPALVVDGVVKSSGHLLSPEQIKKLISA